MIVPSELTMPLIAGITTKSGEILWKRHYLEGKASWLKLLAWWWKYYFIARVWGTGFGVWDLGFEVTGSRLGLGVFGLRSGVLYPEFTVWGMGSGVWGMGFGVWGNHFKVRDLRSRVKVGGLRSGVRGLGSGVLFNQFKIQGLRFGDPGLESWVAVWVLGFVFYLKFYIFLQTMRTQFFPLWITVLYDKFYYNSIIKHSHKSQFSQFHQSQIEKLCN